MILGRTKAYTEQGFDHLTGLHGISDAQITEHLKLYTGDVKQVNRLNDELAQLQGRGKAFGMNPEFAELTRRLGYEYNGMILHEYYFSNLRRGAEPSPGRSSALAQVLSEMFGSVDHWQTAFQAIAEMRGVGWVVLFQDGVTHQLSNH
jgi:Fe-Mn family superoxide dismutase